MPTVTLRSRDDATRDLYICPSDELVDVLIRARSARQQVDAFIELVSAELARRRTPAADGPAPA
jgi:hypothetical protein